MENIIPQANFIQQEADDKMHPLPNQRMLFGTNISDGSGAGFGGLAALNMRNFELVRNALYSQLRSQFAGMLQMQSQQKLPYNSEHFSWNNTSAASENLQGKSGEPNYSAPANQSIHCLHVGDSCTQQNPPPFPPPTTSCSSWIAALQEKLPNFMCSTSNPGAIKVDMKYSFFFFS